MSQLRVILQESVRRERKEGTILALLIEQMDGVDGGRRSRMSLKERLGLKGLGCCGATWGFRPTSTISIRDDDDDDHQIQDPPQQQEQEISETVNVDQASPDVHRISDPECFPNISAATSSGMNLAAALAAERQFREGSNVRPTNNVGQTTVRLTAPGTPLRVSLMRLLKETEGEDGEVGIEKEVENDRMCCVCMGRKKGAAFIPCGHTYCRVCSREVWLNRGSCPLCNRAILQILDIF